MVVFDLRLWTLDGIFGTDADVKANIDGLQSDKSIL
jgi:hypothetical protein